MIGIITFHSASNYGAVLQTYALEQKIQELGGTCEIIDYHCQAIDREYKLITKRDFFPIQLKPSYIRNLMMRFVKMRVKHQKNKKFQAFVKEHLKLSPACYNSEQLEQLQTRYGAVITGSDQVWNPVLTEADGAYFLEFVKDNRKKHSYAASFGNMGDQFGLDEKYIELLRQFQEISVREQSGEQYVSEKVKCDSKVHVDPTLTLNREQWETMAKRPEESRYLLVYTVCQPLHLLEAAKEIARKENLKIIYLNDKMIHRDKEIQYIPSASPEQFVGYFKYADYVLTNSFHGTVFSVIFKRPFLVELESSGGKNQRVVDLLFSLKIQNREIRNGSVEQYQEPIDWNQAEERLDRQKQRAENYLLQVIKNDSMNQ